MKTIFKISALAITLAALWIGCEDVEKIDPVPNSHSSNLFAKFLFINGAPDAPALDFYVNNVKTESGLRLGAASPYANIGITMNSVTNNTSIHVKADSGVIGGVLGSNDLIFRAGNTNVSNFSAASGGHYTVIVVDTLNRPKPLRTVDALGFGANTYYSPVAKFTGLKKVGGGDTIIQLSTNNSIVTYNLVVKYADGTHPNPLINIGLVPLGSSDPGGPRFLIVNDGTLPVPAAGKFAARFINVAPDASSATCTISLGPTSVPGQTSYPMSVAGGFSPSVGSRSISLGFTNNLAVNGTYDIAVKVGSTTKTLASQTFDAGSVYSIVLTGSVTKGTWRITLVKNK